MSARLAILVSGGGSNMEAIAAACTAGGALDGLAEVALVVSSRVGALALERARRLGVVSVTLPHEAYAERALHERAVISALREARATHVVLAGWMRIWTAEGLAELGLPMVNIHPVPTYWYQGARGYQHLLAEANAGKIECSFPTVHGVDAGVDTGDVLLYGAPFATPRSATLESLHEDGLRAEHAIYPLALRCLLLRAGTGYARDSHDRFAALVERAATFTELVAGFLAARARGLDVAATIEGLAIPAPGGSLVKAGLNK